MRAMLIRTGILLAVSGGMAGCVSTHTGLRKTVFVASDTMPCHGVGPMRCLQVREDPSKPWQLWYAGIEGFDQAPGTAYRLSIIEQPVANPPMDGSSIRWVLERVLSRQLVKPSN